MIAIKINQNNSDAPAADHGNAMNANPQTCVAVVASLVNAGVPQADIWIGDPSRAVTDNIFNAIHKAFPNVKVVDYFGNNGRVTTTNVDGVFPNSDVKNSESACFYNARYIIDQPLLKGHVGRIITFGSKNFYGINGILPNWQDNEKHPGNGALTAYMTNANFGGKVVLWCMDAMYPSPKLDDAPFNGVALAPFNGKQMSSFIMSLDGVAEECVSYDFWSTISGQPGGTSYINNAANAGGGVADHWNNSTAKQYAKNLDPNANGIELVTCTAPSGNNSGRLSTPALETGLILTSSSAFGQGFSRQAGGRGRITTIIKVRNPKKTAAQKSEKHPACQIIKYFYCIASIVVQKSDATKIKTLAIRHENKTSISSAGVLDSPRRLLFWRMRVRRMERLSGKAISRHRLSRRSAENSRTRAMRLL